MTKFRPQRGSYANSMAEAVDLDTLSDLERHLNEKWGDLGAITDVEVEHYGFDPKSGWWTWFVYGVQGGSRSVMGYTDGGFCDCIGFYTCPKHERQKEVDRLANIAKVQAGGR